MLRLLRLGLVLLLAASVGCEGMRPFQPRAPTLREPVEVAVVLPLSGTHAPVGAAATAVVELATRRLNEARGVMDRPVRAVLYDGGSTPESVCDAVEALQGRGVHGLVAPPLPELVERLATVDPRGDLLLVLPDSRTVPLNASAPGVFAVLPPSSALPGALLAAAREEAPERLAVARLGVGSLADPELERGWDAAVEALPELARVEVAEAQLVFVEGGVDALRSAAAGVRVDEPAGPRFLVPLGAPRVVEADLPSGLMDPDPDAAAERLARFRRSLRFALLPEPEASDPELPVADELPPLRALALYDAVVLLAAVVRVDPEGGPAAWRDRLITQRWDGSFGEHTFAPLPRGQGQGLLQPRVVGLP